MYMQLLGLQASGIPCVHALTVCLKYRDDPQSYAASFFSLEAYRGNYANSIFPPNANAADHVQCIFQPPNLLEPQMVQTPIKTPIKT